MIILHRVTSQGEPAETAMPLHNFISANTSKDNETWVASWDGNKVYRMVVVETLKEIQQRIFVARHGKKPTAGVLSI